MRIELLAPCLLLAAACGPAPADVPGPRSVLLFTIDTTRADHIGCYGYEGARTPKIDALAKRGVRFASTFSVAPITFPSHVSLLTGTIPPYHGVRDNGSHRAVPELLSLAEILKEEGFQTAAFTAAFVLDAQFGLDQGFDLYEGIEHKSMSSGGLVEERSAGEVNRSAMRWLEGLDATRPFFMWVHYFEPHQPYPDVRSLPAHFKDRPYDAEIHRADQAVGQLLQRLDELGRGEETLVVLTSDHGESLGEHGEATHSFFTYQGTLHVPLVMAHGSLLQGAVVEQKTSIVDVFPTVLQLLELGTPILPPPGRSLAALTRPTDGATFTDEPAYFESLNSYLNYGWAPIQGVAVDDQKLIHLPRPELYDWRADPRELNNLVAQRPEAAAELRDQLAQLLAANEPPEREHSALRELTSSDRAALANLGYTGAASGGDASRGDAFRGDDEEALADPKDGIVRIRKEENIRELVLTGQVEQGAKLQKELLDEDPNNAIFNAHYGFMMLSMQRPADGIPYMEKSLELGFRTAENYSNLGLCYLYSGDTLKAKQPFEDALKIDTKHLSTMYWLARTHVDLGERNEAIAQLEELFSLYHGGDEDPMVLHARELLKQLKQR
jgi:arylsulfatase A-like enzyme